MMHTKRIIAMVAAIAGVAALAAGAPSAQAQQATVATAAQPAAPASTNDELNQLRANQQLLQQRLDQLEQIAQVGVAHPQLPPGTASLAGSFPRSFLIPGTDTSIEVGGRVILDMTEWFHGGNPNVANSSNSSGYGNATISGLPINGTAAAIRSDNVFYMNVQNSRLFVQTQTPTALGEAETYIEFDFADCPAGGGAAATDCSNLTTFVNPLIPRLRLAYATLGPWMFGQNWGIGTDLGAAPETFNSTGIVGMWGTGRVPEASYTWTMPTVGGTTTLQTGVVMPESTMATSAGLIANDTAAVGTTAIVGCTDCQSWLSENPLKNEWPAIASALTWNQPWGHLQLHGAFHDIYLDDGNGLNRSYFGGGGGISGNIALASIGSKDNLGFSLHAGVGDFQFNGDGSPGSMFPSLVSNFGGPGSGCYGALNSNGTLSTTTGATASNPTGCGTIAPNAIAIPHLTAATAALVAVQVPSNLGADVNLQHWWSPTIRSTLNFGYESQGMNVNLLGINGLTAGLNKAEMLGSANLIFSPVPFVDTGVEFFYGKRDTIVGSSGEEIGLDYSFIMKF
jgi:hypothetical protein